MLKCSQKGCISLTLQKYSVFLGLFYAFNHTAVLNCILRVSFSVYVPMKEQTDATR